LTRDFNYAIIKGVKILIDFKTNEYLEDFSLAKDLNESIYMDYYGNMIFGDFDMGIRGLDHNCLIDDDKENSLIFLHNNGVVRVVPEAYVVLVSTSQSLSKIQKEIIEDNGYKIEEYI
jgi:hypothetical protein